MESRAVDDVLSPVLRPDQVDPEALPEVASLGPMFYRFLPRPLVPTPPEYVFLRVPPPRDQLAFVGFVSQWNSAWEADHLRPEIVRDDWAEVEHIPEIARLHRLVDAARVPEGEPDERRPTANVYIVPQVGRSRLGAYTTLYRLLPLRTLERFGLPPLKRGLWPDLFTTRRDLRGLPADAEQRLARAFAHHVWPLLAPGARLGDLADREPLALLAHNLDFWFPYADRVVEARIASYGRREADYTGIDGTSEPPGRLEALRAEMPEGYTADRPYWGGIAWRGEADAWTATEDLVELADADGRLRALVDAVRSHRVEEDFSPRWSWAREDFERRLYRKRNKVRVRFVELPDTVPVHGPASEYGAVTTDGTPATAAEGLLWEDFVALLNAREREIVVCLRRGATSLGDVARELGYANHSPVSKALARIRRKASELLDP